MFRCAPAAEPADFDSRIRKPGQAWLRQHRRGTEQPPSYWRRCTPQLAKAFKERCAYTAMVLGAPGTVDHFISLQEDRRLAYEWSNYRYAASWINSRKKAVRSTELLDPLLVGEDWFELLLPSLQLRVAKQCPPKLRALAMNTLKTLGLRDDERVLRYRREWLKEYERCEIELDYLAKKAPLIARAVQRWEEANGRRWAAARKSVRIKPRTPPSRSR